MSKKGVRAVLVDIDGVLCTVPYRPHPDNFNWNRFMVADLYRNPLHEGINFVKMCINHRMYPVFLTARPEFMRTQTEKMLKEYGLVGPLYMASNEVATKMTGAGYRDVQREEKCRVIRENKLMELFDFQYAIDDHEENAKLYSEIYNIPTLQARFL